MTRFRTTAAALATLALALAALLAGCGDPLMGRGDSPSRGDGATADRDEPSSGYVAAVPFWLDVSNQSFEVPQVRIVVRIDGDVVVDETFDVGTQHNWKRFELAVRPGTHEVTAEAPEHGQTFSTQLTLEGERWATLDYWGDGASDETFSWMEHDRPPAYA